MIRGIFFTIIWVAAIILLFAGIEALAEATMWMAPFIFVGMIIACIYWFIRIGFRE